VHELVGGERPARGDEGAPRRAVDRDSRARAREDLGALVRDVFGLVNRRPDLGDELERRPARLGRDEQLVHTRQAGESQPVCAKRRHEQGKTLATWLVASGSRKVYLPSMRQNLASYEPPVIRSVGSVFELTQQIRQNGSGQWCVFDKRLGEPDYWAMIPIANCS
jgi:hypothetical protein